MAVSGPSSAITFALAFTLAGALPLVVASFFSLRVVRSRVDANLAEETRRSLRIGLNLVLTWVERLSADAARLGRDPELRAELRRYKKGDVTDPALLKGRLRAIIDRYRERISFGQVVLVDRKNRVITRRTIGKGHPAKPKAGKGGKKSPSKALVVKAGRNRFLHSVDIVPGASHPTIRARAPVVDDDFEVLGTVFVLMPLDHRFSDVIRATLGMHVGFYLARKAAASSFRDERGRSVAGLKLSNHLLDRVMRGLRLLQKHQVEFNVLVTVNRLNADYPREIYRFLRDEVGTKWIQFIPIVERVNPDGYNLYQVGNTVTARSVRPEQFGRFLINVFDEWIREDVGEIFVQTFEAAARNWMGLGSSGMCVFEETCGLGLALEHNGDLYSCDHFVEPRYFLGNIKTDHMSELVASDQQRKFGDDKRDTLPRYCLECEVRFACYGGCPRNRFVQTPDGEDGLNYLCAGYKAFFTHVDRPMRIMADLLRHGRYADEVMGILAAEEEPFREELAKAGRNDPCPCGSGRKVKHCHGRRNS